MKILDRYILSRFIYNFIASLFIITLIFVFQTIWLYIDELVGKGLSIFVVIKFIALMLPNLIPLILPLTVVLSAIMTLGALGESYELAAMKASGVSLLRASRTLIVFMILLSIGVFFTFNNLQPWSNRKVVALRASIRNKQPALAISQGIFNNVQDFSIKVGKKTGENGEFLHDIVIHKLNAYKQNRTVIKAKNGTLSGHKKGSDILQLVLKDGAYYEDVENDNANYPFVKAKFQTHILNIDISSLNEDISYNENAEKDYYRTMNISQLSYTLDSIVGDYKQELKDFGENFYRRTGVNYLSENQIDQQSPTERKVKSTTELIDQYKGERTQIYSLAKDNISSLINNIDNNKENMEYQQKLINVYRLTLSDKIALAITCFVLFFVAAPLGAVIRKGGVGMPLVVAIGLFLAYYFSGLLTKNMATNGNINPYVAPWIPTFFLLPLGVYLTIFVNEDKSVGNFGELVYRIKKRFSKKIKS
ncbi:LptF/LptG family permease [uncultured Capnocytophaga sp.]|uniref:LptF/LptG family permease n=1 Tax=uncultured Capnocytophaga sp. TaxID=159273 RepID=UPI00260F2166|nr:LptF/LptG family permease [uncultured Capnocytophaga sp.]